MKALRSSGHDVVALVRRPVTDSASEIHWDPAYGDLAAGSLDGIDAVINLAGRGVADARWSAEQKSEILNSRVDGNALLSKVIATATGGPSVLIAGSAIGFYGDTGDSIAAETADPGDDFLSSVCQSLESATGSASDSGCRVVYVRTGIVLATNGGALGQILPFFKAGIGGRIGSGSQYWSWISIVDEVAALVHLLDSDLAGPVNLVAPGAVTNAEFTRTLGKVLRRPTLLPTPKLALWARLGRELTEVLLYTSTRVAPVRLIDDGFEFTHPALEPALRDLLGRPA